MRKSALCGTFQVSHYGYTKEINFAIASSVKIMLFIKLEGLTSLSSTALNVKTISKKNIKWRQLEATHMKVHKIKLN